MRTTPRQTSPVRRLRALNTILSVPRQVDHPALHRERAAGRVRGGRAAGGERAVVDHPPAPALAVAVAVHLALDLEAAVVVLGLELPVGGAAARATAYDVAVAGGAVPATATGAAAATRASAARAGRMFMVSPLSGCDTSVVAARSELPLSGGTRTPGAASSIASSGRSNQRRCSKSSLTSAGCRARSGPGARRRGSWRPRRAARRASPPRRRGCRSASRRCRRRRTDVVQADRRLHQAGAVAPAPVTGSKR